MRTTIDSAGKEDAFRFPRPAALTFGRRLSTACTPSSCWTAVQAAQGRTSRVLLVENRLAGTGGTGRRRLIYGPPGLTHQPCVCTTGEAGDDGDVAVCWNEALEEGWGIRAAIFDRRRRLLDPVEDVWKSPGVCLPPASCFSRGRLWIAWTSLENGAFRVKLARRDPPRWSVADIPQDGSPDAFRVDLAAASDAVYLVWDQYTRPGAYEVVLAEHREGVTRILARLGAEGERWLCPRVVAAGAGRVYLTWLVLRDVTDDRGIVDHFPFAMVACWENGRLTHLADPAHPADHRIVADLRDGLLASETYKGYVGLRRNPQLALSADDELWCVWEQRSETASSAVTGALLGRSLRRDRSWSPVSVLSRTGYAYAVPRRFTAGRLPVSCLRFPQSGTKVVHAEAVPVEALDRHDVEHHRWQRWACTTIGTRGAGEDRYHVRIGDAEYRLFWADTHCHSIFSADVEGEVDELIHFGRDQAGLDAMAVIDNDYYPHKALTEPEWRIHQAFSAHFTCPGQFVLFPGYEFTFHSRRMEPDFNHRCVIYPRPGGRLLRRIDPETMDDQGLFHALAGSPAMTYPHHCSYRIVDARFDWNVEVCSSWRVCLEETDYTIGQLREGHRFGFVGSSDTHRAVPGLGGALTGLYATALTPEALFDAYRNRRCIATQGNHVRIDFRVAGLFIGSIGAADPEPDIHASVEAPERIAALEVVRDGEVIRQEQPRQRQARMSFRDVSAKPGAHFYFLRVRLAGDPSLNFEGTSSRGSLDPFTLKSRYPHNLSRARGVFAWTSPVWVTIAG